MKLLNEEIYMIDQKIALHLVFSLPSSTDMRCLAKLSDHWGLSFTAGVGLAAQALTSGRVGADPASLLAWVTLDPCPHLCKPCRQ